MAEPDMHGKCDTCGTEGELFVYALPGVPMTVGNCRVCFETNCYPWAVIVGNTVSIGGMEAFKAEAVADWWKDAIRVTCARLGKTVAEFGREVDDMYKEYTMSQMMGPEE